MPFKLYEYKAKYMSRLATYTPKTEREKELKRLLINKLNYLRTMDLPNFVHTLYLIAEHESVSEEFKEICREMIEKISTIELQD